MRFHPEFFAKRVAAGIWLTLAFCLMTVGCAPGNRPTLATVRGIVTLDGHPLANATVRFTPAGPGRTSQGFTGTDGRYQLYYLRDIIGANPGKHVVRITTATEDNHGRELLPACYHAKSVLEATVPRGATLLDFNLRSDAS